MRTNEKITQLYKELQGANIDEYVSKKNTGTKALDYLSWGAAVDFFTKGCQALGLDWDYTQQFVDMKERGSMVVTTITVTDQEDGTTVEKRMVLPCYTASFQAAKDADVVVINKTNMRCLVKCMTLFGLGLKLYMKDYSELDNVLTKTEKEQKNTQLIDKAHQNIKELLDELPAETDTSKYDRYAEETDIIKLRAIYAEIKNMYFGGK